MGRSLFQWMKGRFEKPVAIMEFVSPSHPVRMHIDVENSEELRIWAKHLDVSPEAIVEAVQKVGNAIPAVRKELGIKEEDLMP